LNKNLFLFNMADRGIKESTDHAFRTHDETGGASLDAVSYAIVIEETSRRLKTSSQLIGIPTQLFSKWRTPPRSSAE
jgi:hypothetical protein